MLPRTRARWGLGMRGRLTVVLLLMTPLAGCGGSTLDSSVPGAVWARAYPSSSGRGSMASVVAGGPGLVGVGDAAGQAVVWVSTDGYTWDAIQVGPGALHSVTAGGPGLVGVGAAEGQAAVWVSTDGYAWDTIQLGPGALYSVVAGGPGLVAVGRGEGDERPTGTPPAVWVSADGHAWTRVRDEIAFDESADSIYRLVVGGQGLVALGGSWQGNEIGTTFWSSTDGYSWTRIEPEGIELEDSVHSLTAWGSTLVAAGCRCCTMWGNCGPPVLVWVSTDGRTWTHASELDEGRAVHSVAAAGPGLIAVGFLESDGDQFRPAVWLSADGQDWTRADLEVRDGVSGSVNAVASWAGGLVAVGRSGERAAVWVSPPPG